MSPLLQPLLHQVGLPPLPDPTGALAQAVVSGVSCDSRRVGPGTLFVGLPGTAVDGGSFWPEVLAAGAVAAVIGPAAAAARPPAPGDPVLVVEPPLALWAGRLAAAFWGQPSRRWP
jgi:UDP-N-acetylmuramoyl-L-alanyl-D-glutamate--2,6-diaminopimelate ligase